jgi:hypothetical protein
MLPAIAAERRARIGQLAAVCEPSKASFPQPLVAQRALKRRVRKASSPAQGGE